MNKIPRRTKYRKSFTLLYKNPSQPTLSNYSIFYNGKFGLQSCESGRISSQTIEAARRAINRKLVRSGAIWVKVFAHVPITKKPAEVRMGKGKGSNAGWVATIFKGQVLFEIDGISNSKALQAAKLAGYKIGLRTKCVTL